MKNKNVNQAGFTLVELAIVLVIIGLLVGGVLVGQDLIKAATIRATVADLEKYNAGANTFHTKYGGLPGDLLSTRASSFGLTSRAGSKGQGDGNGIVEAVDGSAALAGNVLGFENALFWRDLSFASLISQGFTTATDAAAASLTTAATVANYLPKSKLRDNAFIHVANYNGKSYYYIGGLVTGAAGAITTSSSISTSESKAIDEKVDDGYPTTGTTTVVSALAATGAPTGETSPAAAGGATGKCTKSTTPVDYNVGEAYSNEINCALVSRTSF